MKVKHDRKLLIAIGRSRKASQWQNKEMMWSEFLDKLATTTRTRETVTDYAAMSKADRDTVKDVGGFVGGYLKNGRRNNLLENPIYCRLYESYNDAVQQINLVRGEMRTRCEGYERRIRGYRENIQTLQQEVERLREALHAGA